MISLQQPDALAQLPAVFSWSNNAAIPRDLHEVSDEIDAFQGCFTMRYPPYRGEVASSMPLTEVLAASFLNSSEIHRGLSCVQPVMLLFAALLVLGDVDLAGAAPTEEVLGLEKCSKLVECDCTK